MILTINNCDNQSPLMYLHFIIINNTLNHHLLSLLRHITLNLIIQHVNKFPCQRPQITPKP